jgi:hypothetical protein
MAYSQLRTAAPQFFSNSILWLFRSTLHRSISNSTSSPLSWGLSSHRGRYFTAVAELNITSPPIPIYVGRNLFHKETGKLYKVVTERSNVHEGFFTVSNSRLLKEFDHFVTSYKNLKYIAKGIFSLYCKNFAL